MIVCIGADEHDAEYLGSFLACGGLYMEAVDDRNIAAHLICTLARSV